MIPVLQQHKPKKYYRSRHEIMALIIEAAARRECTMTQLMYGAYLTYRQIKDEYIPMLLAEGLLLESVDSHFTASERGLAFLRKFEEIREMEKLL